MTEQTVKLIRRLKLCRFRNYEEGTVDFSSRKVVLSGANGSGKSNLLEAVYFLLTLRSFRTFQLRELIRLGAVDFHLEALLDGRMFPVRIGAGLDRQLRRRLERDGNVVRRGSEFVHLCKTVVFAPEDILICSGSSSLRRRFFDMLICGLEEEYFRALRNYQLALRERNALLKMTDDPSDMTDAFERVMAENMVVIRRFRTQYCRLTEEMTDKFCRMGNKKFEIRHRSDAPSGDADACFEKLRRERVRDRMRKSTSCGPQTDDFDFLLDGKLMKSFASNGQLRLISLYLKMAEFELVSSRNVDHLPLIALIDDVTGELDEQNRLLFFETINQADQMFFTFAEPPSDKWFEDAQNLMIKTSGSIISV